MSYLLRNEIIAKIIKNCKKTLDKIDCIQNHIEEMYGKEVSLVKNLKNFTHALEVINYSVSRQLEVAENEIISPLIWTDEEVVISALQNSETRLMQVENIAKRLTNLIKNNKENQ